jgi:hypothetical protein
LFSLIVLDRMGSYFGIVPYMSDGLPCWWRELADRAALPASWRTEVVSWLELHGYQAFRACAFLPSWTSCSCSCQVPLGEGLSFSVQWLLRGSTAPSDQPSSHPERTLPISDQLFLDPFVKDPTQVGPPFWKVSITCNLSPFTFLNQAHSCWPWVVLFLFCK